MLLNRSDVSLRCHEQDVLCDDAGREANVREVYALAREQDEPSLKHRAAPWLWEFRPVEVGKRIRERAVKCRRWRNQRALRVRIGPGLVVYGLRLHLPAAPRHGLATLAPTPKDRRRVRQQPRVPIAKEQQVILLYEEEGLVIVLGYLPLLEVLNPAVGGVQKERGGDKLLLEPVHAFVLAAPCGHLRRRRSRLHKLRRL